MILAKKTMCKLLAASSVFAVLLVSVSAFGQANTDSGTGGKSKGSDKPMPLVNADPEIGVYVGKIETLIREKSYDEAISIIQEMLEKCRDMGFFDNSADGRSYESVLSRINRLLSQMDAEELAKYRTLSDPQAGKLYKDGLAAADASMLQLVADRYRYTSYGPKAIDALGDIYFDTGRFYQAARCWRGLLKLNPAGESLPLLRTKVAVALYLAGESQAGDEMAQKVRKESPDAAASILGRDQKLADFLDQVKDLPVQDAVLARKQAVAGWPGWGGVPNGLCPMDDVDLAIKQQWIFSSKPVAELAYNIVGELLVSPSSMNIINNIEHSTGFRTTMELCDGQIQVLNARGNGSRYSGPGDGYFGGQQAKDFLPGMIHPVVFEGNVIVRTADQIVARGMLDGQVKWQAGSMKIQRRLEQRSSHYNEPPRIVDAGKYALTIGDGKVYGLSDYIASIKQLPTVGQALTAEKSWGGNRLVALWAKSGKPVDNWQVGAGNGDDEIIREGKFITAPTYSNGRLYVVSVHMESSCYLLCLNASNGHLIWKQFLAQVSTPPNNISYGVPSPDISGTPPAIADDRVYALTNSGVVGAFDAVTGQPLWAYQYETASLKSDREAVIRNGGNLVQLKQYGGSPMVLARGRLICLPADSEHLLAMSCEDGLPLWKVSRENQEDLTGIDNDRILLSGRGLTVLSAADGRQLAKTAAEDVNGRPAVSTKCVTACGLGVLYRLNLDDYKLTSVDMGEGDALLGNLVAVEGKLIAANAAGVCMYFNYDEARRRITEKIASASPADKPEQMLCGSQLALNCRQFGEAVSYAAAAMDLARRQGNEAFVAKAGEAMYKAYIASGNAADKLQKMIEQFQLALEKAPSNGEKGLMKVRLAKAYAMAGQFDKAAAAAQDVIEQFAQEDLTDVRIGTSALAAAYSLVEQPSIRGQLLGKQLIDRIIEQGGRECYKTFDAQAEAALKVAAANGDSEGLLAIDTRWPNAKCVSQALFQAAELFYKAAHGKPANEAQSLQDQAVRLLDRIRHDQAWPTSISAKAALAVLLARGNAPQYAAVLVDGLWDVPANTEIAFDDIRGQLGDLLKKIDAGDVPNLPADIRLKSFLDIPARQVLAVNSADVLLLRDQNGQPVRIGELLAAVQNGRVVLIDTMANDEKEAVCWSGLADIGTIAFGRQKSTRTWPVAGLSRDGKLLVVASQDSIVALEVATAKIKWRKTMAEIGVGKPIVFSVGGGCMLAISENGRMTCLDIDTAGSVWQAQLPMTRTAPTRLPPTCRVGVPQIGGDLVAVVCNDGQAIHCYNIRSGKLVGKWQSQAGVDALLGRDGLLVTVVDAELAARDLRHMTKPLWAKAYAGGAPGLLAMDGQRVAVSRAGADIDVVALADGKVISTLKTAEIGGNAATPVYGRFDGECFYVLVSSKSIMPPRLDAGCLSIAYHIGIEKFQVEGKVGPLWAKSVPCSSNGTILTPLEVGPRQVIFANRSMGSDAADFAYMLDTSNGVMVGKFQLGSEENDDDSAGDQPDDAMAWRNVRGSPVMTNGRLCVETLEGVAVYGK